MVGGVNPVSEVNPMVYQRSRQRGGTIIGIVFGILLGLAAAVAVAVYVTKVPVPFVDRAISRTPTQDAAEQERNKNWNPNAALIGKPAKASPDTPAPATTQAGDTSSKPDPSAPSEPNKKPEKSPDKPPEKSSAPDTPIADSKPTTPPAKPQSSDPLGDLAKASSQGKPIASSTPVEPIQYFVQVGAFNSPEDAQAQRAKMALMGLDARITEREQAGRTVFRVRLGPFERQEEAEKMKTELHAGGTEAALVRVQR